ncbi:exonuclease III [Chitinophaga lutea]|uniref:Exonuclease III n=1 Tax=Chitinophaga lutea TaxID=2488634 RepID=A0A3N4PMI9_9BACT|nr:endonuclease/exonuclease/phosphatase family protein [Chitinophaga lutea]RPE08808.1 exonuclease III [Chitinophaga lutea]
MKKIICFPLFLLSLCAMLSASAQGTFRVLSYNILEGMVKDTTKGKTVFVEWVKARNPDVVALQECNGFTQKTLEELALSYGHPYAVIVKENGYPTGLTSRYPIADIRKVNESMTHGFIMARIEQYNIVVLHLNPHKHLKRRAEIAQVLKNVELQKDRKNWIMMGDFNSVSPLDKERIEKSGYIARQQAAAAKRPMLDNLVNGNAVDYQVQQHILDAGFTDAGHTYDAREKARTGKSIINTDTRIDYIYLSSDLAKKLAACSFIYDDFTATHSDHRPILLDLKK